MALYDARRNNGRTAYAADYYQRTGILDRLLEYARLGIVQDEQARLLNEAGLVTARDTKFTQGGLSRIIKRAQELGQLPQTVD